MNTAVEIDPGTSIRDASLLAMKLDTSGSAFLAETTRMNPFGMYFDATGSDALVRDSAFVAEGLDVDGTPLLTEQRRTRRTAANTPRARDAFGQSESDPIQDRVTLLARKYAAISQFSEEEKARLAIVTERVRQLLPSTTMKDVEAAESLLNLIERVSSSDKEIRERIGFSAPRNA